MKTSTREHLVALTVGVMGTAVILLFVIALTVRAHRAGKLYARCTSQQSIAP